VVGLGELGQAHEERGADAAEADDVHSRDRGDRRIGG
jgi:hypothetical protein